MLLPLFVSWLAVTMVLAVLVVARSRLESREADWLPLATSTPADIHKQELLDQKVHRLTPIVHWLEAVDVLLLLLMVGVWIYQGIHTVRW